MKTLRVLSTVFACALMFSFSVSGQAIKKDIMVTIDNLDYEPWCPGMGTVDGYYIYTMTLKLNKAGYLERFNWHVSESSLRNQDGDKIIIVDSGTDNLGINWDWFNKANYYNDVIYNCPEIVYDPGDGWLNDYLPAEMPSEGVTVGMPCKMLCKGLIYRMPFLAVTHINANGDITVDFIKP